MALPSEPVAEPAVELAAPGPERSSPDRFPPKNLYLLLVFSVDFEPPELLQHFINHYTFLGVPPQNFLIILHSAHEGNEKMKTLLETMSKNGVAPKHIWIGEFLPDGKLQAELDVLTAHVGNDPDKWVVTTDADELHLIEPEPGATDTHVHQVPDSSEVTADLLHVIADAREKGRVAITGHFVDRTTADCALKDISAEPSLWKQFPRRELITKTVLKGCNSKVLAHSAAYRAVSGHHKMVDAGGLKKKGLLWTNTRFKVHHFKWIPSTIPKLQLRAKEFKEAGLPYW
eukprot:CAMPEP_0196653190 /NCGR_PEP_ID=MMETSP1086-20130531/2790_1 /TAXON_ID=77921 /ORGANISM="Cyanoptyche  gloeocystis , Strain SAG4.97" /LENGTH=286 /DNA_ID=CAMNT_0041984255 /DNA_START=440 /DNA_END=1297 /DNA_ORIENTATION=+